MCSKQTTLNQSIPLSEIHSYLALTDQISTSGQPTAEQFSLIQQAGFKSVINLAPDNASNAIENEHAVVTQTGMAYLHIPVDFKHPTPTDFDKFVVALTRLGNTPVWIHCAANMRVSAFMYKYRRDVLKQDEVTARKAMEKIWQPNEVWQQFLDNH